MKTNQIRFCIALYQRFQRLKDSHSGFWSPESPQYAFLTGFSDAKSKPVPATGLSSYSDLELFENYRTKNCHTCMTELYRRYHRKVLGTCYKILKSMPAAEDSAAKVFEKILLRKTGQMPRNFSSWIFIVARNEAIEIIRKEKRRNQYATDDLMDAEHIIQFRDPFQEEKDSPEKLIHTVLFQLPQKQKVCIYLFFLKGLRYKEISQKTGLTLKEVKNHLQNGKRKLKILLEPYISRKKIA